MGRKKEYMEGEKKNGNNCVNVTVNVIPLLLSLLRVIPLTCQHPLCFHTEECIWMLSHFFPFPFSFFCFFLFFYFNSSLACDL